MRSTLRTALVVFFVLAATAQAKVAEVTFPSTPDSGRGFLAAPAKAGKHPALIVVQEWWGVDDWIKGNVERFAANGYVALAPDLYRGKVAKTMDEAHELSRGLPQDRAMADLKAAFNYLASRSNVDANHIGIIGWCMGGGYALDLALAEPRAAALVINYGHLMTNPDSIASLTPPILGNFGANDGGIPPKDVQAFEQALVKAGKRADVKIYANAGHAFMNPNNKKGYVKEDADDAWKRIDAFLAKALKPS